MGMRTLFLCLLFAFVCGSYSDECIQTEYINGTTCYSCTNSGQNRCTGCNGLPLGDPPLVFDHCGVCGGTGGNCMGCDGVLGSGKDYDDCGVCGGTNACADESTEAIVFDPIDSPTSQKIYKLPLTINLSSGTPGANVYYKIQVQTQDEIPLSPPSLYLTANSQIITSQNITVKAIAHVPGKRISVVKTAIFLVSETGSKEGKRTYIPGWAIAVIVVVGSIIVVGILFIIFFIRIRNRKKMVAINLDATERAAKEDTYRAIYDYKANNNDELDLRVGDIIFITERHADGWWEGTSFRLKGKKGLFPGNYVELVPPERLMWVERPKTVMGRFSQRVSNFFGGGSDYGTDPQLSQPSKFTQRVSRMMGIQTNNSTQLAPPKPSGGLPPRPTGALPPKPGGALPPKPGYY